MKLKTVVTISAICIFATLLYWATLGKRPAASRPESNVTGLTVPPTARKEAVPQKSSISKVRDATQLPDTARSDAARVPQIKDLIAMRKRFSSAWVRKEASEMLALLAEWRSRLADYSQVNPAIAAEMLLSAGPVLTFLAESGALPASQNDDWRDLLLSISKDSRVASEVRAAAIRTASVATSGKLHEEIDEIFAAAGNDVATLRALALALGRNPSSTSVSRLEELGSSGNSTRVFETVCLALGEHPHPEAFNALLRLVRGKSQEDSLALKLALGKHSDAVARAISDPANPLLPEALKAVRYTKAQDQRDVMLPRLSSLIGNGQMPPEMRTAIMQCIWDLVRGMPLSEGNAVLARILPVLEGLPECSKDLEVIRGRISAVP